MSIAWTPNNKLPSKPCFTYPDADLELGISMMVYGTTLIKLTRKKRRIHSRRFYLNPELSMLCWISPKKTYENSTIPLWDIVAIKYENDSDLTKSKLAIQKNCTFTILFREIDKELPTKLSLEFRDYDEMRNWSKSLEYLIIRYRCPFSEDTSNQEGIRRQWIEKSDIVTRVQEFTETCINIQCSHSTIASNLPRIDTNHDGLIDYNEYIGFLYKLSSIPAIMKLVLPFQRVKDHIRLHGLKKFYKHVQHEKKTLEECKNDIVVFSSLQMKFFDDLKEVTYSEDGVVAYLPKLRNFMKKSLESYKIMYDKIKSSIVSIETPFSLWNFGFLKLLCSPINLGVENYKFEGAETISNYMLNTSYYIEKTKKTPLCFKDLLDSNISVLHARISLNDHQIMIKPSKSIADVEFESFLKLLKERKEMLIFYPKYKVAPQNLKDLKSRVISACKEAIGERLSIFPSIDIKQLHKYNALSEKIILYIGETKEDQILLSVHKTEQFENEDDEDDDEEIKKNEINRLAEKEDNNSKMFESAWRVNPDIEKNIEQPKPQKVIESPAKVEKIEQFLFDLSGKKEITEADKEAHGLRVYSATKNGMLNPIYLWRNKINAVKIKDNDCILNLINISAFEFFGDGIVARMPEPKKMGFELNVLAVPQYSLKTSNITEKITCEFILANGEKEIPDKPISIVEGVFDGFNLNIDCKVPLPSDDIDLNMLIVKFKFANELQYLSALPLRLLKNGIRWFPVYDINLKKLAFSKLLVNTKVL